MDLPVIPTAALCLLLSLAIYRFIIFPAFFAPLSKVPNIHWSAPFSPLWILHHRYNQRDTPTIHGAHVKHGPLVRVAPNELSINCVDGGIRTIYGGGFGKGTWYSNAFDNYGIEPMFGMQDHGPHSKRKRMLSNVYAKSTLQSSEALAAISKTLLQDRLIPRLQEVARSGKPTEAYELFSAVTLDFITAYVVGLDNGSDFIRQPERMAKFLRSYKARQVHIFWPQELPRFTAFMERTGLKNLIVPAWVKKANEDIEAWILEMCDSAERSLTALESESGKPIDEKGNYPTVYAQLRNALLKDMTKTSLSIPISDLITSQRLEIASELADQILAGFDTSGVTLTYLAWELSRPHNTHWQNRLRAEIQSLEGSHDPKSIDALPIFHAILMETLRLHAAIPGQQPRLTPPHTTLGDPSDPLSPILTNLPANIRVQSQAWTLHRHPSVFPDPETWNPARWLPTSTHPDLPGTSSPEQLREMSRWFWAFGSGGRMCVGSNLAVTEMKAVMVAVWGFFESEVVGGEGGMRHNGGYLAEPVGLAVGKGEEERGGWLNLGFREL